MANDLILIDDEDEDEAVGESPEGVVKSAADYLELITSSHSSLADWTERSNSLDLWYADLARLADLAREREMQLFWANIQTIGPAIYSRPPVPVVVPAFKDKRPLNRLAAELLERTAVTAFRLTDVDYVMRLVRDDLIISGRGQVWVRYDDDDNRQSACIDFVNRDDFAHDPARNWSEVGWVAKRSWLNEEEAEEAFSRASGDAYKGASYAIRKDPMGNSIQDRKLKAGFWEMWHKAKNLVVWITEGVDVVLDESEPLVKFDKFFPCPRPAYGTLERPTLKPVPDMLMYKDQIEEINELTGRIGALTESLKLKGFYPAGAGEIGDAIDAAMKEVSNNAVLIPISNWAALGGAAAKDVVLWLPLEMIATTITACITLRKQLIDDVYQITGLSDIQRGSTDPDETLGAQELKSQYGSVRVHDKQHELVRFARDMTVLVSEIAAEKFTAKTFQEMSQLQVPTDASVAKQIKPLQAQFNEGVAAAKKVAAHPQAQQAAQANPQQAQQAIQAAEQHLQGLQQQIQTASQTVTIEQVVEFLRDNSVRPLTLDIETDSTIAPDEAREQKQAAEFLTAVGGYMAQSVPMVEQVPQLAPVVSAFLKFVASKYRVGRDVEGVIDEFADEMVQIGQQPKGPTPAAQKQQADQAALEAKNQIASQQLQIATAKQQADAAIAQQKLQSATEIAQARLQLDTAKHEAAAQKLQDDTTIASLRLMLDKQVHLSGVATENQKNETLLIKHHSIEATKDAGQALANLTKIQVAEITAGAANDGQMLSQDFEREADLAQHAHEKEMQQADHEADAESQDSAQEAATTAAAVAPQGPAQ